jgi:hypothetical protein
VPATGISVTEILAIATAALSIVTVLIAITTSISSARKDSFAQLEKVVNELRTNNSNLIQAQARTELEVRYARVSSGKLQASIMELISVLEKIMIVEKVPKFYRDEALTIIARAKDGLSAAQSMNQERDKTQPFQLAQIHETPNQADIRN